MKISRSKLGATLSALCGLAATAPVAAIPITYTFTTGTASPYAGPPPPIAVDPGLAAALSGFSVGGTFVYDDEAPLTSSGAFPPLSGGVNLHANAITNLEGSVAGLGFSDPTGAAVVGDEAYQPAIPVPPPPGDFLQLSVNVPGGAPADFLGFTLLGHELMNVRLFWIEGLALPDLVPDFLPGVDDLPGTLPTFNGRLALDFGRNGALLPNNAGIVFFDNLRVNAVTVPEPATALLLGAGLLPLLARRRAASA